MLFVKYLEPSEPKLFFLEFRRRCDPEHRESVEGVHQGVRRPRSGADSQRGTASAAQAPRKKS